MKKFVIIVPMVMVISLTCLANGFGAIKIGVILGLTGKAAGSNKTHMAALKFAVDEINTSGGVLGEPIKLYVYDNRSTAIGAKKMAKAAVKEGVVAVIGCNWSSHTIGAAKTLQKAKIPIVSPISTNPDVTLIGDYVFRVCYIDPFQGRVMANFAYHALKARKAVLLIDESRRYSKGLAQFFKEYFQKNGGEIVFEGSYLSSMSDYAKTIDRFKPLNTDVIFLPGDKYDSGKIIKQSRNMGVTQVFLGGDGWSNYQDMYHKFGSVIEGNYFTAHWHLDPQNPVHAAYEKKFKAFIDRTADIEEDTRILPLAYDAVMVVVDAIKRAQSKDSTQIKVALQKTTNFSGITGRITFDAHGDPIKPAVIMKLEHNGATYIQTVDP